jgi:predicted lipoprotein with Yx(FWY)xxD motif
MRPLRYIAPVLAAAVLLAGCGSSGSKTKSSSSASTEAPATTAAAASAVVKTADTKLGTVLVDAQGRTLYHRTDESGSHIVCIDKCATTWPPLFAPSQSLSATTGVPALTVVKRPDGKDQVAAADQPLYTFAADAKPGDTNGEGVAGIWHVIKAQGASSSSPPPAGATATTASSAYGY